MKQLFGKTDFHMGLQSLNPKPVVSKSECLIHDLFIKRVVKFLCSLGRVSVSSNAINRLLSHHA